MALSDDLKRELDQIIKNNEVVLFMKGTKDRPACGFSAAVTSILDEYIDNYTAVNVLERADIREGIKEYSSWPTIPQLYVKGEFIGGSDIVRGMEAKGEMGKVLGVSAREVAPPKITITDSAAAQLKAAMSDAEPGAMLRFEIDPRFNYGLSFDQPQPTDLRVETNGLTVVIDKGSAKRAEGSVIDWVERPSGGGFRIENPAEPPRAKPISATELKAKLDAKEPLILIDVRGENELKIAKIPGARPLDENLAMELKDMDRDRVLVFSCHLGQRSFNAAQQYASMGFKKVFSLDGGIDAWSRDVDPTVPRY